MTMKGVSRGVRKPPRITIYGPPKVGKSTFGSESPSPIFVPTEDGIDNVPVDRFERAATWEELLDQVGRVAGEKHDYKTVVLDTLNGAAELAAQHVCATKFGGDWGPKGYGAFGQGPSATSEEIRRLLALLDLCRERGMILLLLAHAGIQSVRNPVDGDYQKFCPDLDRRIWARVAAWADIIGRAEFEHRILKRGTEVQKAVGGSVRVVHFTGSAAEDAGCRVGFELPERLPLSWQAFADALGDNSEVTSEITELWSLLSDEQQAKALEWLGVRKIEDAAAAKARQLLNRLRKIAAERAASNETKEDSHAA